MPNSVFFLPVSNIKYSLFRRQPWSVRASHLLHLYSSNFTFWRRQWQPTPVPLAWKIPGMEEPGGLPSMGLQSRTRLKWLSSSSSFTFKLGDQNEIFIFKAHLAEEKMSICNLLRECEGKRKHVKEYFECLSDLVFFGAAEVIRFICQTQIRKDFQPIPTERWVKTDRSFQRVWRKNMNLSWVIHFRFWSKFFEFQIKFKCLDLKKHFPPQMLNVVIQKLRFCYHCHQPVWGLLWAAVGGNMLFV